MVFSLSIHYCVLSVFESVTLVGYLCVCSCYLLYCLSSLLIAVVICNFRQVAYIGPCIEPPHFPFFEDQNPALPRPEPTIVAEPTEAPRPVTAAMPDRPQRQSYCPSEDECSLLYLPVCGSDGVTYLSWCHLRVVACGNKVVVDSLSVVHMGECLEQGDNGKESSFVDFSFALRPLDTRTTVFMILNRPIYTNVDADFSLNKRYSIEGNEMSQCWSLLN